MQIVSTIEELERKLAECGDALINGSDDAMRAVFSTFRMDFSGQAPPDPFSHAYRDFQMALYERIAGKPYVVANEATLFNATDRWHRPFPFYTESTTTAGNHLGAIAFLLRTLDVPVGARMLEFGPGWGSTTIMLAQLGMQVTAVEIERNFCEVIRARAAQNQVAIDVVEGDFFFAEDVTEPYDAVVFFECFHHCHDHVRLLRALHHALKPGGTIYFASEPIVRDYPLPWGLRMDGESLWAIRNFGWLELGYDEAYFREVLRRTGWTAEKRECADPNWAGVWIARRVDSEEAAPQPRPDDPAPAEPVTVPAASPAEDLLRLELQAVKTSTSWRVTAPLRALGRLVGRP